MDVAIGKRWSVVEDEEVAVSSRLLNASIELRFLPFIEQLRLARVRFVLVLLATSLVSLIGGAAGLCGSVMLMEGLSAWQPFLEFPIDVPVSPDNHIYGIALLLALASGFLFGAVPVRQVLRTDSYEIVKSGARSTLNRRVSVRDLLLGVQIAICAVLVTSSLVAVRGLMRSLHGHLGIDPRNGMLVLTDPSMAGYKDERVAEMQQRMIDAMAAKYGQRSLLIEQTLWHEDGNKLLATDSGHSHSLKRSVYAI